ncbi:hypothetical protein JCM3765_004256 [Sporobolomyces pararoseus]
MFALKAMPRLTNASSQLSTRSTILRYLSTEPAPQDGPVNVHEAQSKERSRSIRKVSEEGGAHSQLIALAVKNTAARAAGGQGQGQGQGSVSKEQRLAQAKRQLERRKTQQQQQGQSNSSSAPSSPRNDNRERSRQPRTGGGDSPSSDALALLRGNAQQRLFNPRFNSSPLNNSRSPSSGGPRPPRRNSPGSSASASSPKSKGPRNKSPRQSKPSSSSSSSVFSVEDTKPLVPPPQVSYPSINLAQLLRADLAAKTLQVKRSVDNTQLDGENSEDPKVREQTRKVLNGDYSQWTQVGGDKQKKGGDGALEHAKDLLSRNPSVGLKGREVFINKLKEVL